VDLLGADDAHALGQGPIVNRLFRRRADADLRHPPGVDQTLADGVVEHRAMAVAQAEAVRPGVHVGVEVDQPEALAMPRRQGAQQREGDGVVAAQRDQVAMLPGLPLDHPEARLQLAHGNLEVADVGKSHRRGKNPVGRVVAVHQHPAGLPDRGGAEAAAAAVGGADVEGNADHGNAAAGRPDAEEGGRDGERRRWAHRAGSKLSRGGGSSRPALKPAGRKPGRRAPRPRARPAYAS
jgi:hypothetical protein